MAFSKLASLAFWATCTLASTGLVGIAKAQEDPCAVIGMKDWLSPADVRACFRSFTVNETTKSNILDVVNKTIAFHTSVNYQIQAPSPFSTDVHENIAADLARIRATEYEAEYDFHIDLSRSFKRLNDGHAVYISNCYDSLYLNFIPTPLVLLTNSTDSTQSIHIAPEAYNISSSAFGSELRFWERALPTNISLQSLSGAKVLAINGEDPWVAVNANAQITGSFQSFGTRQNSLFSSYQRTTTDWVYVFGNFAQQSLPLSDEVSLTVQRNISGEVGNETIVLPYRSQFGTVGLNFTDSASYRARNCLALNDTNGQDLYPDNNERNSTGTLSISALSQLTSPNRPVVKFQQQPPIPPSSHSSLFSSPIRGHGYSAVNVMLSDTPSPLWGATSPALKNALLPPHLLPSGKPLNGSSSVAQFYLLQEESDGGERTGVLMLGSFSDVNGLEKFLQNMLEGLKSLVDGGATRLVVDVTNNGGGYICAAHWLHRIIAGPKQSTVPNAGLPSSRARALPLSRLITNAISSGADPANQLMYNPLNWRFKNDTLMPKEYDWLEERTLDEVVVNGREDVFSQRLGQECQPWELVGNVTAPEEALFDTKKVVIITNGRCASSCALFSITMSKHEGSKTAVIGGKSDVQQQYCGTVGGQSTDFSTIDMEVKSTKLKDHELAPPDFLTNSVQGLTWRLGFGIDDPNEPEEWQDHPADLNLPLTADLVNNPTKIWQAIAMLAFDVAAGGSDAEHTAEDGQQQLKYLAGDAEYWDDEVQWRMSVQKL